MAKTIEPVNVYTFSAFNEQFEYFLDLYEDQVVLPIPAVPSGRLIPKGERICRFCGAANDPKCFQTIAHLCN